MLIGTQRTELNYRILSTLIQLGQGVKSSVLAEHLQVAQRDVVGRLQALKRREMVAYERNSRAPSAAGLWTVSKQGRQSVSQMTTASQGKSASR